MTAERLPRLTVAALAGWTSPFAQRWPRATARVLELASFGSIGAIAFVVDVGVYNLLRVTLLPESPIGAKVASVVIATAVAWLGNRHLTFRGRGGRATLTEALLFALSNAIGLLIAVACLAISHYVLGLTSPIADNIAANVVGVALGSAFRYLAYRHLVFRTPRQGAAS